MSGGFYKYRCKNFYTYNCQNWVYMNNAACSSCTADGRDETKAPAWRVSRDICVPRAEGGVLYYTLMEVVATGEAGPNYWQLRYKANQQPQASVVVTTSATPGVAIPATTTH
ncbi:Uu.00g076400.m01.CDS01 [Anthostomella pinea]|uniref:Uu.00g076400.m01.CDS01 n=1 Tax=Anthostomella pinea TaxID=933095 RepID=A0AAI8VWR5_9PEZI|nr:Uu.00g076400.m01.CDS01 [Anthostomella pinea]